jgi:hypothetical protein
MRCGVLMVPYLASIQIPPCVRLDDNVLCSADMETVCVSGCYRRTILFVVDDLDDFLDLGGGDLQRASEL